MKRTTQINFEPIPYRRVKDGNKVRCDPDNAYSDYDRFTHSDGYLYGKVVRSDVDSDGDIKVRLLDESGVSTGETGYFDAHNLDHVPDLWQGTPDGPPEPDRDLEEYLEGRDESESLAVLEEEEQNLVQMQELRARTVRPGVLHLNVKTVTSAANSEQWAIIVEHPVCGELRFYREKPLGGWSDEYAIVKLLKSYGIEDGNPYKLQMRDVYLELTGDDPSSEGSWTLRRRDEVIEDASIPGGSDEDGPTVLDRADGVVESFPPWLGFAVLVAGSFFVMTGAAVSSLIVLVNLAVFGFVVSQLDWDMDGVRVE